MEHSSCVGRGSACGEAAFEGRRSSSLAGSGFGKGGARECIVAGEYLADPVEK